MTELSVVLPGIRNENWVNLYQSILKSTTVNFELIFVGPRPLPEELLLHKNIKYIHSMSSPTRSFQMGMASAVGEYFTLTADDVTYRNGTIDKVFNMLNSCGREYKTVVTGKYTEGFRKKDVNVHYDPKYYLVRSSPATKSPYLPKHWWIFNLPFMKTEYFKELGGLDCRFEGIAMSLTDLANRAQRFGSAVYLPEYFIADISRQRADRGDHGPIYYSQIEHDQPLYSSIYGNPNCVSRTCIDFNNWKKAPDVWRRRFG